ncbi:MAG TPA: MBL fold metallo-hydrolase [Steroidobacteraceae bacterium]
MSVGISVTFWGVRGSVPTPGGGHAGVGGNTTCVEVQLPSGDRVLIDGGTGARALGAKLMQETAGRELSLHMLLTHFHWDHIQGIPFFQPLFSDSTDFTFYAMTPPAETAARLQKQMAGPYFSVGFDALRAKIRYAAVDEGKLGFGNTSITSFPLSHPQGCRGYRFECAGSSVVFASDFEYGDPKFDRILLEAADGADVLILDAQYTPAEYEVHRGWGHTSWLSATQIARTAGAKKLVLFHHDPAHDDAAMESILQDAQEQFPGTSLAKEGDRIELP